MSKLWSVSEIPVDSKRSQLVTFSNAIFNCDVHIDEKNVLEFESGERFLRVHEKGAFTDQFLLPLNHRKISSFSEQVHHLILPASEFQSGTGIFGVALVRYFDKKLMQMKYPEETEIYRICLSKKDTGTKYRVEKFDPKKPLFSFKFEEDWDGMFRISIEKEFMEGSYEEVASNDFRITKLAKNNILIENLPQKTYLSSSEKHKHKFSARYSFGQPVSSIKIDFTFRKNRTDGPPIIELKDQKLECQKRGEFECEFDLSKPGDFHWELIVKDDYGRTGKATGDIIVGSSFGNVQLSLSSKTQDPTLQDVNERFNRRRTSPEFQNNSLEQELYRVLMTCEKCNELSTYKTKNEIVVRVTDCLGKPQENTKVKLKMISKNAAFIATGKNLIPFPEKKDILKKISELDIFTDKKGEARARVACSDILFEVHATIVTKEGFKIPKIASLQTMKQDRYMDVYISKFGGTDSSAAKYDFSIGDYVHVRCLPRTFSEASRPIKCVKFCVLDSSGLISVFTKSNSVSEEFEMTYQIPDSLKGKKIRVQCISEEDEDVMSCGEGYFQVEETDLFFRPEIECVVSEHSEIDGEMEDEDEDEVYKVREREHFGAGEEMKFRLSWKNGLQMDSEVILFRRDTRIAQENDIGEFIRELDFEKLEPAHLRSFLSTRIPDYGDILNSRIIMDGNVLVENVPRSSIAFIQRWEARGIFKLILVVLKDGVKGLSIKRRDTVSLFLSNSISMETSTNWIGMMSEVDKVVVREYKIKKTEDEGLINEPIKFKGYVPLTKDMMFPSLDEWFMKNLPWVKNSKQTIIIKKITGQTYRVVVDSNDSIKKLREKIGLVCGFLEYQYDTLRLIFGGTELPYSYSYKTVGDLGIGVDGNTIYLLETKGYRGGTQIIVRDLSGKELVLEVSTLMSVKQVKVLLQYKIGVSPDKIQILSHGKEMEDDRTLEDYAVRPGQVFMITCKIGGDVGLVTRSDFVDTDFVILKVKKGSKNCIVKMRGTDSMTTYEISAIILNEVQVGVLEKREVEVKNPVFMQLEYPNIVNLKDKNISFKTIVENVSEEEIRDLFLSIGENENLEFLSQNDGNLHIDGNCQKIDIIKPQSTVSLDWRVKPKKVGDVSFDVDLVHESRILDKISGSDRSLTVVPYGDPIIKRYNTCLFSEDFGDQKVCFTLSGEEQDVNCTISLFVSKVASIKDSAMRLMEYPHGCCEQTASSTLPNVIAYELMKNTNTLSSKDGNELMKNMCGGRDIFLREYVNLETGGVGLWNKKNTSVFHTALVLGLFGQLQKYIEIDDQVMEKMTMYLLSKQKPNGGFDIQMGDYTPFPSLLTSQATTAYVIQAISFLPQERKMKFLDAVKKSMKYFVETYSDYSDDITVLSLLLDSMTRFEGVLKKYEIFANRIANELINRQDRTKGFWKDSPNSFTRGGIENTSYALLALGRFFEIKKQQESVSESIKKGIHYILSQRTSNGWYSTRDTLYAILALNEFADKVLKVPELPAEASAEIFVNGKKIKEFRLHKSMGTIQRMNMSCQMRDVFLNSKNFQKGENCIEVKSEGWTVQSLIETRVFPSLVHFDQKSAKEEDGIGTFGIFWDKKEMKIGDFSTCTVEFIPKKTKNGPLEALVMLVPIPSGLKCEKVLELSNDFESFKVNENGKVVCYTSLVKEGKLFVKVLCKAVFEGTVKQLPCKVYDMYDPENSVAVSEMNGMEEIVVGIGKDEVKMNEMLDVVEDIDDLYI